MRSRNTTVAIAVILFMLIASGCASKKQPAAAASPVGDPPQMMDLSLQAELPKPSIQAEILSLNHDASGPRKPGDRVSLSAKATVPPDHRLVAKIGSAGEDIPLQTSGPKDAFAAQTMLPSLGSGSFPVEARILDPAGKVVARRTSLAPIEIVSLSGLCETLQGDLNQLRVNFAYDSAELDATAKQRLGQWVALLKRGGELGLERIVEGHCDARGSSEYNLALGDERAKSAKDYVAALGLDVASVRAVSFGKEKPLISGDSESAHAQNRRVEVRLTCPAP